MNEIRKLIETIEKIEEGYFKEIDIENQERAARYIQHAKSLSFEDMLFAIRTAHEKEGSDVAEIVHRVLHDKYNALEPRFPKRFDSGRWALDYAKEFGGVVTRKGVMDYEVVAKELEEDLFVGDDIHARIKNALREIDPKLSPEGYKPGADDGLIDVLVSDPVTGKDRTMVYSKQSDSILQSSEQQERSGFNSWLDDNPFEGITEEYISEAWPQQEETHAEMVDYWKKSLSSSIVSKGVFTKLYDAANRDIDELNYAIEDQANSIADSYHGSGEGIGSSDVNHFIAHIGSSLGIEDLFGWRKPKDEKEYGGKSKIMHDVAKEKGWDIIDLPMSDVDEATVEVPPEFRGGDEASGSSDDVMRFLNDIGPDDSVDTEVVDPETGELLDWPTKDTRRQQGQEKYAAKAAQEQEWKDEGIDVPFFHMSDLGDSQESAWQLLNDLRDSDFYNVVWRETADSVEDPEMMRDNDYDIDVEIPVLLKRKDGEKLIDADHDNIKEIIKAVKAASTLGNIGIGYAGTSNGGTTARFHPQFH